MAYINLLELAAQAHKDIMEHRLDAAYAKIEYLIDKKPYNHFHLYLLGSYYSKMQKNGLSLLAYEKCAELYPDFSEAINNLGGCYRKAGFIQKAKDAFERAVMLGRTQKFRDDAGEGATSLLADYVSNLGSAHIANHTSEIALKYLDEAVLIDPNCTNARWNRSLALLELGRYEDGFAEYDEGERLKAKADRNYMPGHTNTPYWTGDKDKTVVVYGEQGIGDELMFATILPDMVKDCKKVIYDAHPRLYRMFRRAFSEIGIDCYGTRKDHHIGWVSSYKIDAKVALGSIAKFYRKSWDDFPRTPYLIPDAKEMVTITQRLKTLPQKINIGISWKGGTDRSSKRDRVMKMEYLKPLFEHLDANFISLQYDENAQAEVDKFNEQNQYNITHWPDTIANYEATLALVSQLDLIISVPQSVVHLAGANGARAYQLCPYNALWQMGVYGHEMPWYNCVTNIWQESDGGWDKCISGAIELAKKEFTC